jgi:threonine synthase
VLKNLEQGRIGEGATIVCTLTGHGLKDPDTAIAQSDKPLVIDATKSAIAKLIAEKMSK